VIDAMCQSLVHRGPDSSGLHIETDAAIGMTRLAVIDLVGGDQPLYSEDRSVVLVLNGEIYNHHELRAGLRARGHRFATRSDAEVVVHLWEEHGERCVQHLRGMFAFAIWDAAERRLFLARDRLGKKPLVYVHGRDSLAFASEIPALLRDPDTPRAIDPDAIDAFLVNQYVPGPRCIFAGMHKLPPASTLTWSPGGYPRIQRYWAPQYRPKLRLKRREACEHLRELILDAVTARLDSDVPLGAFLSGGIDSSAVVAAMARCSSGTVRTFTAAFAEADFDERMHARRVAELYGTEHRELEVGHLDPDLLLRIARHFGEPLADPAILPAFVLAELTRRHVTVCLGGDGGDEAFAGYRRYWQIRATLGADRIPRRLRHELAQRLRASAGGTDGPGAKRRLARLAGRLAMPPARRFADLRRFFRDEDRRRLYGPALRPLLADGDPLAELERAWEDAADLGGIDRAVATDLATYLPDDLLVKADITSMAHALELRSPLLDQGLMEFAAALPERMKVRGRTGKAIFRQAVAPWLPAGILDRPKHGFAVPVGEWMRRDLRPLAEDLLLDDRARGRELFDASQVERLLAEHMAGADRTHQLWAMLSLELWFRASVDAPRTAEAAPTVA
jgi:asparagine synthase (glutamine-hydrolysing)